MKKLIKSGTIVTAEKTYRSDILIEGEKITQIALEINCPDAEIIDATDRLILPGGVDAHVHLSLPMAGTISSDDHYTGGKAAAFGGTTSLIDFVSQDLGTLEQNIAHKRAEADSIASVDYGLHMNITRFDDQVAEEITRLPALGVTTVKVFTAYNKRLRLSDGDIFKTMRIAGRNGILTMVHAENGDVIDILVKEALQQGHTEPIWHARTRPGWGEVESSLRGFALGAQAGAPVYLVHMNVAEEVDQLAYARAHNLKAMGETCPQYLFFTEEDLKKEDGAKWICSPPMRTAADQNRLWQGIQTGTIQVLSTDHCPFFYDGTKPILYENRPIAIPGKELGKNDFTKIPNGLPGVGDRLPLFWGHAVASGKITPNQFVALTSTNPARIFGLYPRKGCISVGSDADIVLWDPEFELNYGVRIAQHRTDYNLYEGWKLHGFPRQVFLRGQQIVRDGQWFGKPGGGRYLRRTAGEVL